MKILPASIMLLMLSGCLNNRPDGLYDGPAINSKCALEVPPPKVPETVEHKADTSRKADPLIRQDGLNVCRSF